MRWAQLHDFEALYAMKRGLERDGVYLAIEGERKDEVRADVHDWLKRLEIL